MKPMPVRNPATVHRILEDLIELSETDMDTLIKKYEMDPELIDQIDESLKRYHVAHNVIGGSRKKKDYRNNLYEIML